MLINRNTFAAIIPAEKDHVISLDGTWRFKLEQVKGNAEAGARMFGRPTTSDIPENFEPFYKTDYREDENWKDLAVPGNWEMAGLSPATYNQPDNASGFYRKEFEVPADWKGRRVLINFDGVQNGAEFFLNGEPVNVDEPSWGKANYHEGGWTAFQVDLTPKVKFGEKNLLAIRVTKNTKSVDLDTGDYFFLGGIHRPVTLFSVPQEYIADVTVQTHLLDGDKAEVKVAVKVGADRKLEEPIVTATVGDQTQKFPEPHEGRFVIEHPKLWSAEHPNMYELEVELQGEKITRKIGIREVSITKDGVMLLNGKPIKLAGVCRHDVQPDKGTAVDESVWRKDLQLMREANINAVRTSHYPYGSKFYDLCDEMGFYVADELPYCWTPTDEKDMTPAFLQRARETLRRDKNHPSVIIWAIGNENKAGPNLQAVADLVKSIDDTRPRLVSCMEFDKFNTEFSDSHYTNSSRMQEAADKAKEEKHPHIYLENPNVWDIRLGADAGCLDIWSHVLSRAWDVVMKNDVIPGTFVWEWQDRAVRDKSPTKNYHVDESTGIQFLKTKGIVDGLRNPRPELYNIKNIFSPIKVIGELEISPAQAKFEVENRYSFTDLSELKTNCQLLAEGKVIERVSAKLSLPPLSKSKLAFPLPGDATGKADTLRVDFTRSDGSVVVSHQFRLIPEPEPIVGRGESPFPQFNLLTREQKADKKWWRIINRTTAKTINVKEADGKLDADIALETKPDKVVGHVHAELSGNEFSYRIDWTGPKTDLQEIGWKFAAPKECDHFSWSRHALWTAYPDTHIGRAHGTAMPDSADGSLTDWKRPDSHDFDSTKYDCDWASLADKDGKGLLAVFDEKDRHHCRGGITKDGYELFVNKQVNPPTDISSGAVSDLFVNLTRGMKIEGKFKVGRSS